MKPPEWKQNVLLLSDDLEVRQLISSCFGDETQLVIVPSSEEAIQRLDETSFHVLIADAKTTDPKLHYTENKQVIPFLEVCQYAVQQNQKLTVVVLVNRMMARQGEFARKCGATLIMDRKAIEKNVIINTIRDLRKRTFRTLLTRDLVLGQALPVDLYHYLPLNDRYAIFVPSGEAWSEEKQEKLGKAHVRHLFVREQDLDSCLAHLRSLPRPNPKDGSTSPLHSEELSQIRERLKNLLIELFDTSSDGRIASGKRILSDGMELTDRIEKLVARFPDDHTCLAELPYPRWSALAHSVNCAIYALIFSKACGFESPQEIAFAALMHNLGLSELDQKIASKNEMELTRDEMSAYRKHPFRSLEILKRKMVPISPRLQAMILNHHEQYDGKGFPEGISGDHLVLEASLISVLGSFDHLHLIHPGEKPRSAAEAWAKVRAFEGKFHPQILSALDQFFSRLS